MSLIILGKHLRAARKRLKLKQSQVAEMAGVSLSYFGKLERGQLTPAFDRLALICDILQIPMSEVFKGVELNADEKKNLASRDVGFEEFFLNIDEVVGVRAKDVMVKVCREITTLDE